ncbi:MAG: phosphoribosylglycinamide formyltransferase [Rhodobacteraceae bacterium]|nr:phosphoribosylglycinamide formyltransferase [Paracoccaceae bacterium]
MTRRLAAILISGGGSNMVALVRDMADPAHPATPCLVISNRPDAAGLARAADLDVPTAVVDHRAHADDRPRFEAAILDRLAASGAEILCLAGFMRILTPGFVEHWRGRILNIHPSILPLFPGLDTHARALAAGMAVHGATVHEVTPDLDSGPILGQAVIPVLPGDTPETLAARLLPMEHRLYPAVLRRFAAGDRRKVALFP